MYVKKMVVPMFRQSMSAWDALTRLRMNIHRTAGIESCKDGESSRDGNLAADESPLGNLGHHRERKGSALHVSVSSQCKDEHITAVFYVCREMAACVGAQLLMSNLCSIGWSMAGLQLSPVL